MIIGKTSPIPDDGDGMPQRFTKKDASSSLRHSESGMVDSVLLTTGADGQRFVKMRVRATCAGGTHSSPAEHCLGNQAAGVGTCVPAAASIRLA